MKKNIEDIRVKYYSDIDEDYFYKIVSVDPTMNSNMDLIYTTNLTELKNTFKYKGTFLPWLIKMYKYDPVSFYEDYGKINHILNLFHREKFRLKQRDIFAYKSIGDIYEVVEIYDETKNTVHWSNENERLISDQFKVVFKNSKYRIIIPLTLKASEYFGDGTLWCTKNRLDTFESYTKEQDANIVSKNNLYILYTENPDDRLQFHFRTNQFRDIKDRSIKLLEFFNINTDIYNFFVDLNHTLNNEATLDLSNKDLNTLTPDMFKDELYINASNNKLRTLDLPAEIISIDCSSNNIETLEIKSVINGDIICNRNQIKVFKRIPNLKGSLICTHNELKTLQNAPKEIEKTFNVSFNKLIDLQGGPITVGTNYIVSDNGLVSLLGAPNKASRFYCFNNKLKTLQNAPISCIDFNCNNNELVSLSGCPDISGDLYVLGNKDLAYDEIIKYKHKVKGSIYTDYGIIKNED